MRTPIPRWPNVDVHLYEDRDSRWRARLQCTLGERAIQRSVPALEEQGFEHRTELYVAIEDHLCELGVRFGLLVEADE